MNERGLGRIITLVVLVASAVLLVLGLQEAQTGNLRPLIMAALGFFIVWYTRRRIT